MGSWWVKFPMYNVELQDDIGVGAVRLRPLLDHAELCREIREIRHSATPFIHTADAIIELGESPEAPSDAWQEAWEVLWPVHQALRFLQQRDFRLSEWSVHETPECEDEAPQGGRLTICTVPYETAIQFRGSQQRLLEEAARTWSDDGLAGKTAFQYAVNCQHTALGVRVVETAYIQQWIAFEVLFNRWCDTAPEGPKETEIEDEAMAKVRRVVGEALDALTCQQVIDSQQAKALTKSLWSPIRQPAIKKARAFLDHHGIHDVDPKWLERCIELRNHLMHGRTLTEAYRGLPAIEDPRPELSWRTKDIRRLVNRCVMSLIGYKPDGWDFPASRPGRYVRKENGA